MQGYIGSCSGWTLTQGRSSGTWTRQIHLPDDRNSVAGETAATAVAKGTQVTLTAIPNTNYRFNRWTGNIEQNPYTLAVTEDLDLEAEFESTL